jgi:hypothetical protein
MQSVAPSSQEGCNLGGNNLEVEEVSWFFEGGRSCSKKMVTVGKGPPNFRGERPFHTATLIVRHFSKETAHLGYEPFVAAETTKPRENLVIDADVH